MPAPTSVGVSLRPTTPVYLVILLQLGSTAVTHRNGQAAGANPDLRPEVSPEASEMKPRLKAEPSPGPEIVVGPIVEAHRTRGAGPGTRMEQYIFKAHPNWRCRVAPGLTGCTAEKVER
ncbi:hypothetical protein MRX96_051064 [Rhipicephalus microplus]